MNAAMQAAGRTEEIRPLSAAERRNRCAGIAALLAFLLYAFVVDPERVHLFKCFFKELTGWNCLTCGLTHSLHAAAHLHVVLALKYHLFGPALLFAAVALLFYWISEVIPARRSNIRIHARYWKSGSALAGFVWLLYWLSGLSLPMRGAGL